MNIIIADAESDFIAALIVQLADLLPEISFRQYNHEFGLKQLLELSASQKCLVLYNAVDFPGLPEEFFQNNPAAHGEFWPMRLGLSAQADNNSAMAIPELPRLGSVKHLSGLLQQWIKSNPVSHAGELLGTTSLDANSNPQKPILSSCTPISNAPQLNLLVSIDPAGYRPDISHRRLIELVRTGRRVIYLPLMPTYQMVCLAPPGQGPSISDLLLQLLGQHVQAEQIGQYWQPHPEGFFQFRPPDRSDDLVLCSPEILRKLVVLLRERLILETEPCSVFIDCAGIPLTSIASIGVLCDSCEVSLPDQDCFAADAARREISQLLAVLPTSCKIRETRLTQQNKAHILKSGGLIDAFGACSPAKTD